MAGMFGARIVVDLEKPEGESFELLRLAKQLAECLGKNADEIQQEMMASDRLYLIEIFRREFRDYVHLLNEPRRIRRGRTGATVQPQGDIHLSS